MSGLLLSSRHNEVSFWQSAQSQYKIRFLSTYGPYKKNISPCPLPTQAEVVETYLAGLSQNSQAQEKCLVRIAWSYVYSNQPKWIICTGFDGVVSLTSPNLPWKVSLRDQWIMNHAISWSAFTTCLCTTGFYIYIYIEMANIFNGKCNLESKSIIYTKI